MRRAGGRLGVRAAYSVSPGVMVASRDAMQSPWRMVVVMPPPVAPT